MASQLEHSGMFSDVFGLYSKALFGDESSTSACILWVITFKLLMKTCALFFGRSRNFALLFKALNCS